MKLLGIDINDNYASFKLQRAYTQERVREYFCTHPGAHNKDAAAALNLCIRTVSMHRCEIASAWRTRKLHAAA